MLKQTLIEASLKAGNYIKEKIDTKFEISNKIGMNNLVTEIDKSSEKIIIDIIAKNYPEHSILSEEIGNIDTNSEYKWIIDPLDGTVNFAHGIPICATSIAIEKNNEIILAAIYHPFLNEIFIAEKGKGATLNDKNITVSKCSEIDKSFLVTGFPYEYIELETDPLKIFGDFIKKGIPVRRLGSAAIDLCWVAAGRFDGFYEFKLNPWDIAAGFLIVNEAGGRVTDFKNNNKFNYYGNELLATNNKIHDEMIKIINTN